MVLYGKDKTTIVSNGFQSRMSSVGRPMSEVRPIEEGLHKPGLWIEPEELTGYRPRSISEDTKEKIDRFDFEMDEKCLILDSI